jgi:hypothetical protein
MRQVHWEIDQSYSMGVPLILGWGGVLLHGVVTRGGTDPVGR